MFSIFIDDLGIQYEDNLPNLCIDLLDASIN